MSEGIVLQNDTSGEVTLEFKGIETFKDEKIIKSSRRGTTKKNMKAYQDLITIDSKKRFGRPCVRDTRITVYDVLSWLSKGMSKVEIIEDFPELTEEDISACLAYAAERERGVVA